MIRISASDLESYRYWRDSESAELPDLVSRLTHTAPATREMEAGRALARFFEHACPGEQDAARVDGWEFVFDLDEAIVLPPMRELKAEIVLQTPSGPVTLVCKADGIDGTTVHDQKLSSNLDAERYMDSLQWRAYLVAFGANRFVYDIFVGKYDQDGDPVVTITEYHTLPFYAYPEMRTDVQRAVEELAEVITRYIPQLVTADAA